MDPTTCYPRSARITANRGRDWRLIRHRIVERPYASSPSKLGPLFRSTLGTFVNTHYQLFDAEDERPGIPEVREETLFVDCKLSLMVSPSVVAGIMIQADLVLSISPRAREFNLSEVAVVVDVTPTTIRGRRYERLEFVG